MHRHALKVVVIRYVLSDGIWDALGAVTDDHDDEGSSFVWNVDTYLVDYTTSRHKIQGGSNMTGANCDLFTHQ
jgi:hypothetical protein